MRSSWSSLVFLLLVAPLLLYAHASAAGAPSPPAAAEQQEHGRGHAAAAKGDAFYRKVGRFAVMVYSMWHEISPVPKLEGVVSASTRPGPAGGVDYLLVLRVARLGTCRALVWGVPSEGSQDWKLKYFEPAAGA